MERREDRHTVIREMISAGATYQAIGVHFGLTRERVRQIANQIGAAPVRNRVRRESVAIRLLTFREADKTASKTDLSLKRLRELLHYDRYTGIWTWLVDRGGRIKAGDQAGNLNSDGYVQIRIDYKLYMAHVLAWFYSFEQWPKNIVDHENRVRHENWLNNLRQATHEQNFANTGMRKNNTSGFKGVHRSGRKWKAEVAHIKLGTFDTAEEASAAYEKAAKIRYGEFASTY